MVIVHYLVSERLVTDNNHTISYHKISPYWYVSSESLERDWNILVVPGYHNITLILLLVLVLNHHSLLKYRHTAQKSHYPPANHHASHH